MTEEYRIFAYEGCKTWARLLREHANDPCEYTAGDMRRAAKWLEDLANHNFSGVENAE